MRSGHLHPGPGQASEVETIWRYDSRNGFDYGPKKGASAGIRELISRWEGLAGLCLFVGWALIDCDLQHVWHQVLKRALLWRCLGFAYGQQFISAPDFFLFVIVKMNNKLIMPFQWIEIESQIRTTHQNIYEASSRLLGYAMWFLSMEGRGRSVENVHVDKSLCALQNDYRTYFADTILLLCHTRSSWA